MTELIPARAFVRCTSGHYFHGEYCPFDGWSSTESKELAAAVRKLQQHGTRLSLNSLRQMGVSWNTLERTLVIDFGSTQSVFEALSPEALVIHGEALPLLKTGKRFK